MAKAEKRSFEQTVWGTVRHWDLFLAVAAGVGILLFGLTSNKFDPSRGLFLAATSLSLVLGIGAWVAGRWVADKLESDYGEIARAVDVGNHGSVHLPYTAVSLVGLIAAGWSAIGAILIEGIEARWMAALISAFSAGLVAWILFGSVSLVVLSYRHARLIDRLRRTKERADRVERGLPQS